MRYSSCVSRALQSLEIIDERWVIALSIGKLLNLLHPVCYDCVFTLLLKYYGFQYFFIFFFAILIGLINETTTITCLNLIFFLQIFENVLFMLLINPEIDSIRFCIFFTNIERFLIKYQREVILNDFKLSYYILWLTFKIILLLL